MSIHVKIKLSYRNIPYEIEIDTAYIEVLESKFLGQIIDKVQNFIDKWLKIQTEAKTNV